MSKLCVSFNNEIKEFECNLHDTVINLKKELIKLFDLKTKYIDIHFKLDRPIRGMGKFNLDNGLLLRTFDNFKLNKWNLENKTLQCEIFEIDNYEPEKFKPIIKKANSSTYRPPSQKISSGDSFIKEANYNLESNEDFPSLG
jgi:hypothetical protein